MSIFALILILAIHTLIVVDSGLNDLPKDLNIPTKDDAIVIVGGGPSGVDMAARLKNLGYSKITILEKNDKVGGKSQTIERDGIFYDLGTVILLPRYYYRNMIDLIQHYDLDSRSASPQPYDLYEANISCTVSQFAQGCSQAPVTYGQLVVGAVIAEMPEMLQGIPEEQIPVFATSQIIQALKKYQELHYQTFCKNFTTILLPQPPSDSCIFNMTAKEFLDQNDLKIITIIMKLWQTGYGYGYLDELPAFYLLQLINPYYVRYFINILMQNIDYSNLDEQITRLNNGFQPLWQGIVDTEKIDVETSFEVTNINRQEKKIIITGDQNGEIKQIEADFIFITIPLSLPILENPSAQEVEILSNIETSTFTATLLQGSGFAGDTNTVHSFNNANQGGEASQKIWWQWNRRGQISGVAPNYGIDIDNRTITTLQYHYNRGLNNNYADIALDTIKNGGFDEMSRGSPEVSEIFEQIVFDQYFPRYSNEGLKKGGHWRFLDIQGQQNTIYLGSLPSGFDTTEHVVTYNKMIAEKIEEQLLKESKNFGG